MNSNWRIFTDCTSEPAARRVASRHFTTAGIDVHEMTVEPYHKGGFLVSCANEHRKESWPTFVVSALAVAQATGRSWMLHGNIAEELDAWSNELVTPGITAVHLFASGSADSAAHPA